ncbi:MAG TPA: ATP-binding protein [Dissulfurispiraceae bacterium]|nr:ATP-binding protein [Dissulfurispiraceae bacterium]
MMIERRLLSEVTGSLQQFPVVGLLGPRQVGKTTLARTVQAQSVKPCIYLDLELPSDLNKLHDPELYLQQFAGHLIIIDEVQRMPGLFPVLRALVDQNRTAGRFLLLGSASPDLIRNASESLAGRIIYHELSPLTIAETDSAHLAQLWLRGGFPLSFLADDDTASARWREAFIRTYLEMDIPQLGVRIPSPQLRRFWTMLAHMNGQLWNASQIAASLGISPPTAKRYLDLLQETFLVRQLQPFHANVKKRLVKSPKAYLRDTGLCHTLLGISSAEQLAGVPYLGASWESFCVEQIARLLPAGHALWFYRTAAGAEIDLVVPDSSGRMVAIEIKYSSAPKVGRGFWSAFAGLACKRGYVVYPGAEAYSLTNQVQVLPAVQIAELVRSLARQ